MAAVRKHQKVNELLIHFLESSVATNNLLYRPWKKKQMFLPLCGISMTRTGGQPPIPARVPRFAVGALLPPVFYTHEPRCRESTFESPICYDGLGQMGRNRDLRRKIASLRLRIGEHESKIQRQSAEHSPDEGLIEHWRHEISAWEKEVVRLARRLERNR